MANQAENYKRLVEEGKEREADRAYVDYKNSMERANQKPKTKSELLGR